MANNDIRTNVVISAETKGFDTAQQKAAKVSSEAAKGMDAQVKGFADAEKGSVAFQKALDRLNKMTFREVQKQIGGLKGNLVDLHKEQLALTEVMSSIDDKAGPEYDSLKERLKKIKDQSKDTEQQVSSLTKAFAKQAQEADRAAKIAEQRSGAFLQGMAQGGLPMPAPFLQRGPGMGRQMAGMAVGSGLRGAMNMGRGAGTAMFGGVQGMATGISSIPMVGGALAGQFQQAAAYAQQNIEWQRTRLAVAPYMESTGARTARGNLLAAGSSAYSSARAKRNATQSEYLRLGQERSFLQDEQRSRIARSAMEAQATRNRKKGGGTLGEAAGQVWDDISGSFHDALMDMGITTTTGRQRLERKQRYDTTSASVTEKYSKKRLGDKELSNRISELDKQLELKAVALSDADVATARARRSASSRLGGGIFGSISSMGLNLMGAGKPEAAQVAAAIAQAGGGYARGAKDQGILSAGFAAKTVYGIGPETTGAFFGAGRRGGMVGAEGRSGDAFKNALAEGLSLGFSKSELNRWMQMTAQGIQQFEQTGIPVNTTSISALAGEIIGAGITGTRAAALSRGISGGLQGIGSQGIQSGTDLMMLQLVGGYQGGGAADYRAARARMERMDIGNRQVGELAGDTTVSNALRTVMKMAGADPASQAELLQQVVTRLGGRGSVTDFDWLQRRLSGGEATPEQLKAMKKEGRRRRAGSVEAGVVLADQGLEGMAAQTVREYAPSVQKQEALRNRQITEGGKMVDNVIALEKAAFKTTQTFNTLAGDTINNLTENINIFSTRVLEAAEYLKEFGINGFFTGK